jgi:hypothetical protein
MLPSPSDWKEKKGLRKERVLIVVKRSVLALVVTLQWEVGRWTRVMSDLCPCCIVLVPEELEYHRQRPVLVSWGFCSKVP